MFKSIDVDDIIIGDKNAIVLATRILGYGADYKIEFTNDEDEKESSSLKDTTFSTKN